MSTFSEKDREMQSLLDELEHREAFSYEPESDLLYQQYRDQYQKLGRQAMEDTVGQTAGLTGGYGSTYGETAGAEAYNAYLGKLNDILPELYDRKQAAYGRQTELLYDRLSFAENRQEDAFDRCMELLENGIRPSEEELAAAGVTPEQVATALAVFQYKTGFYTGGGYTGGGSAGGGYTGGGSAGGGYTGGGAAGGSSSGSYDNGSLTAEQVKELQSWLGVTADGEYGPKTQAAAEAYFGASGMTAAQAWAAYQQVIGKPGRNDGSHFDIINAVSPIAGKLHKK